MKNLLLVFMAVCLIVWNCTKGETAPPLRGGGDDDDGPIIMEITKDVLNRPIQGATVRFVKGEDTLSGQTNSLGKCTFTLPSYGVWGLKITHPGYQTIETSINLHLANNIRVDTLSE